MKRSEALAPLSREHHVALEVALRLRHVDETDAAAVRDTFLEFFASEGDAHFAIEEAVLLPSVAGALPTDDPDVTRVREEHSEIRQRAAQLEQNADASVETLRVLGDLLDGHIRHEERVLFPRIEAALSDAELAQLGAELQAAGDAHTPPRT